MRRFRAVGDEDPIPLPFSISGRLNLHQFRILFLLQVVDLVHEFIGELLEFPFVAFEFVFANLFILVGFSQMFQDIPTDVANRDTTFFRSRVDLFH